MSSPQSEAFFTIVSSDNINFVVTLNALNQSRTLGQLISNLNYHPQNAHAMAPIPVSVVNGETLRRVVRWCERHKQDQPMERRQVNVELPPWDKQFLEQLDNKQLFDLICAANYLDIPGLLDVSCKKVALMIKGKTPEEMREYFGIPADEEDDGRLT